MIPATLATPVFLKLKIFQNKAYDLIILKYDATNQILSRDLNYIVDAVM